jgi:uncharacterized phage-associated protein
VGAQHTALAVADKLIRLSLEGENLITPMQAQKLTYFCHAWMLGTGNGPLFQDAVESWQYGPVIRSVYHALKHHGRNRIREGLLPQPDEFSEVEEGIIKTVWRLYGSIDGIQLSRMTHAEGTPWHQTYSRGTQTQIIHNHVIRDYYADILKVRVTGRR